MQIRCTACSQAMRVEEADRGHDVVCATCERPIHVPARRRPKPVAREEPPRLTTRCRPCGKRTPADLRRCVHCGALTSSARREMRARRSFASHDSLEAFIMEHGIIAGILAVAGAAGWFYWGWQQDRIFIYPPILALIGIVSIVTAIFRRNEDR